MLYVLSNCMYALYFLFPDELILLSTFERIFCMKRVLYKCGIIIIIITDAHLTVTISRY